MTVHLALLILAWGIAICWFWKVIETAFGLPQVPDLLRSQYDLMPRGVPRLSVVVPARNEERDAAACLESLMQQDYANLQVIAVDDRSTDSTGKIMDAIAEKYPQRLRVLHITELPSGWLGKTHAMSVAAQLANDSEWLLFTDADVLFRSDCIRRSLAYAVEVEADHLVTMPTTIVRRWDEGTLLGFLQVFGMWATRPWKVSDPKAKRDAIGIGAFNLIRKRAYEQVGGFEALRMVVIEDLNMARRIKAAGLRQRVAFGRGLVSLHWASGALGIVHVMTKNMFSAFNFSLALAAAACVWLVGFCFAPMVGLFLPGFRLPSLLVLGAMAVVYRLYGRSSGIPTWQVLLSPMAVLLLLYATARSILVTLWDGGITWRGTFYPLAELKKNMPSTGWKS